MICATALTAAVAGLSLSADTARQSAIRQTLFSVHSHLTSKIRSFVLFTGRCEDIIFISAAKCLEQRASLVNEADNGRFTMSRNFAQGQRPHMRGNDVRLLLIDIEMSPGIRQRLARVEKSVKLVAVVRNMPIIKKQIMKNGAADDTADIGSDLQLLTEQKRVMGDSQAMLIRRSVTVLTVLLHLKNTVCTHQVRDIRKIFCRLSIRHKNLSLKK